MNSIALWSRRRESNPHGGAYEAPKVSVPSLRSGQPILAGRTGFEPVALFADNEAATPAVSRPLTMVPAITPAWSARGDSNPDLHGLSVPRLPIAPRADGDGHWSLRVDLNHHPIRFGSAYGYRTRPPALATRNAPPHPGRPRAGGAHRPNRRSRQLSKNPLFRAGGRQGIRTQWSPDGENGVTARLRTIRTYRPSPRCRFASPSASSWRRNLPPAWRSSSFASGPQQKRPSRGAPQKAWFSMNAGPLGRFALRIKHAVTVAQDPRSAHG
jgi:hypothetical protein